MSIVAVDIGNTTHKAAVYEKGQLLDYYSAQALSVSVLRQWHQRYKADRLIFSSVGGTDAASLKPLEEEKLYRIYQLRELPLPFTSDYQTPETLGSDRLACMIAADELYPGQSVLVVQCGSCLTFDLMHERCYRGGSISPGLAMRFKALSAFTAKLPLLEPDEQVSLTGRSTASCIQAGVWHGYLSECASMIEKYRSHYENLNVILTGGDAEKVNDKLKKTTFAHPNLVLYGLYVILNKHVENQ